LFIIFVQWDNTVGLWSYEGQHALEEDEENIASIQMQDGTPHARRSSRFSAKTVTCPIRIPSTRNC